MDLDGAVVLRIYTAEAVAIIAAARLGSAGIDAHVQKDDCGGAYPALQMSTGVRLLVRAEDLQEAESILAEMEAEDRTGIEQEQQRQQGPRTVPLLLIGVLIAGFAAGYVLAPHLQNPSTFTGIEKRDYNNNHKPGTYNHFVKGQIRRVENDRNFDGKPDAWFNYSIGKLRSATLDDNFDGKPDKWISCDDLFNYTVKVDTNFDGKPDATQVYVNGLLQRTDWHPNDSAIIERRELYEHDVLKERLIDTDGDGYFDLRITYDRYERPIAETKTMLPQ